MIKVYVAGASAEIERCEAFIKRLRDAGFEITFDWPAMVRSVGSANGGLTDAQREDAAQATLQGVVDSDWLVLLQPRLPSIGCWVELGVGHMSGTSLLFVGDPERTIFSALARVVASEDEALDCLKHLVEHQEEPR